MFLDAAQFVVDLALFVWRSLRVLLSAIFSSRGMRAHNFLLHSVYSIV